MKMFILISALIGIALGCEYNGQTYQPGDNFPSVDGCNTCFCSSTGRVGCTLAVCTQGCEYEGEKYSEGDSFPHKDGCNECFCSRGGRIGCTMTSCQDQFLKRAINPSGCHYNGEWHEAGATYTAEDGCNTCSCGMNGRSMCSRKLCENRVLKRAIEPSGCYYNGEWHEVGATYTAEDDCNKCSCSMSGQSMCTQKYCQSGCYYGGRWYAVDDVFYANDGCNTCRCTSSGMAACSRKSCRYTK